MSSFAIIYVECSCRKEMLTDFLIELCEKYFMRSKIDLYTLRASEAYTFFNKMGHHSSGLSLIRHQAIA